MLITNYEKENSTLSEEVRSLRTKNHELLEKTNKLMEAQYNALSTNNDESRKIKHENLELMNEKNALKFEIEDIKSKYEREHSNNETLQEKLHDSLEKNNIQLTTINNLNEMKVDLEHENNELKKELANIRNENESRVNNLENELQELKEKCTNYEKLNNEMKENMAQGNEATKKNLEFGERVELLENSITMLQSEKSDLLIKQEELKSEAETAKQEKNEILHESKQYIMKLKSKHESSQLDLIKRVLEFIYIKLLDSLKNNDEEIDVSQVKSSLKNLSKLVLSDPQSFDDDDDDDEDDVNNTEEA